MKKVVCPVCGADVELADEVSDNDEVACPVCGALLRVFAVEGAWQAEEIG